MGLVSLITGARRSPRERVAERLAERGRLLRRGLGRGREAVAQVAGAARAAGPQPEFVEAPGRSHTKTAVAVTAVAVTAVAVGTCAYLWWRHRREEEYARLLEPEPERPSPVPATPPGGERAPSTTPPTDPLADVTATLAGEPQREPVVASFREEALSPDPDPQPAPEPEPQLQPSPQSAATVATEGTPQSQPAERYQAPPQARRAPPRRSRPSGDGLPRAPGFSVPDRAVALPSMRTLPPQLTR